LKDRESWGDYVLKNSESPIPKLGIPERRAYILKFSKKRSLKKLSCMIS